MTLQEAKLHFQRLQEQNPPKKQAKLISEFSTLITKLDEKKIEKDDILKIEAELDRLIKQPLSNGKEIKYRKAHSSLVRFLQKEFSLVKKGYYMEIGIALGMALGMSLGMSLLIPFGVHVSMGLIFGMVGGMIIGIIYGQMKDKEAELQNKTL